MNQLLARFPKNEGGRDFVIGDLHGCLEEFRDLLQQLQFNRERDRMFSVGDLIDRGPESLACLSLIAEPWFFAVQGNHELMMLDYLAEPTRDNRYYWESNGGEWGVSFHREDHPAFRAMAQRAALLPKAAIIATSLGDVGVCHAEPPEIWSEEGILDAGERILWARRKYRLGWERVERAPGVEFSLHGHTPLEAPVERRDANACWIDLGCFSTGRLCAVQISGPDLLDPLLYYDGRSREMHECKPRRRKCQSARSLQDFLADGLPMSGERWEKLRYLYSPEDSPVRFVRPENGYDNDQERARRYLQAGNVYTIDRAEIGGSWSFFYLKEFPGVAFNTVQFEPVASAPQEGDIDCQ